MPVFTRFYSCVLLLTSLAPAGPLMATEAAQFDYMINCQGCHLDDGRGYPARQVPPLQVQMGKFLSVKGGREFLVQVPGAAQSSLSDEQLAVVLNWMLRTFSPAQLPADFKPYSAAEIHPLRTIPLVYVTNVRADLLARIADHEQQLLTGALSNE